MVKYHEMQDVRQKDNGPGKHTAGIRAYMLGRDTPKVQEQCS